MIRLVPVKLRIGAVPAAIRNKAEKLKKTDAYSSVFIFPDQTLMQRRDYKNCVAALRRRCQDQANRHHLIWDGVVISMDKEMGSGDKEND